MKLVKWGMIIMGALWLISLFRHQLPPQNLHKKDLSVQYWFFLYGHFPLIFTVKYTIVHKSQSSSQNEGMRDQLHNAAGCAWNYYGLQARTESCYTAAAHLSIVQSSALCFSLALYLWKGHHPGRSSRPFLSVGSSSRGAQFLANGCFLSSSTHCVHLLKAP